MMAKELKPERMDHVEKGAAFGKPIEGKVETFEKNRRIKLGILALVLTVGAYALAKITNDTTGDWFKFALLTTSLAGIIGGFLTFTDILGKK